jgi:hypothetical protein
MASRGQYWAMAAAMRAVRALAALALCLFSTLPAAAQRPQTRVALVIANSAYQNATPLPNPVADGRLIAATLKGAGFQSVTLLENQDRIGMERGLRAFAALAERAEVAMLYYAGHGIEYNGENYLIPIDAKLQFDRDLELEAVKLSTMISMSEGASRLRIIVLDACRTPPSGLKKTVASRSLGRGLAPVEPEGDSLIVYSAKAGTTAADGDGGNSPFAKAMARRMLQPGREISLLFRDIRDDVLKATGRAQEPFTYGSLSSQEFYFIDPPRVTAVAAGPIDMEAEAWGLCRGGASRAPCDAYIGQYPQGRFVSLAKTRAADFAAGASITTMAFVCPTARAGPAGSGSATRGAGPGERRWQRDHGALRRDERTGVRAIICRRHDRRDQFERIAARCVAGDAARRRAGYRPHQAAGQARLDQHGGDPAQAVSKRYRGYETCDLPKLR